MAQCENHERFVQVALDFDWELYEYGLDSTCIAKDGGPHLTLIWLKPCSWDPEQMIPVGCFCCTNLDEELLRWNGELYDLMEERRYLKTADPEDPLPKAPPSLGPAPTWLPPYRAR